MKSIFKQVFIFLPLLILLHSCASLKKSKNHLKVVRSEKQLKKDIDFVYNKLQKLHPDLYWYISKKELDYKFDSLKSAIHAPMTSNDFYFALSPVVASIKQGHTRLARSTKVNNTLPRFNYDIIDNKLYITKNNYGPKSIQPGTEIVSVNTIKPQELMKKYKTAWTSDGYIQTFFNRWLCKNFETYMTFEDIPKDSIVYELKYNDTIQHVCLNCKSPVDSSKNSKPKKQKNTPIYNAKLSFCKPDSSIALMKITEFTGNNKFYKTSFETLNKVKSQVLILDLRDNSGGLLTETFNLYAYLVDTNFCFIEKSELTSKTSLLHTNYFRSVPLVGKFFFVAFTPLRLVFTGIKFFKVKKGLDNKYYYSLTASKPGHPQINNFKGKVYVIINGGSYSATSILSSNLKGSKRAVFIGEETGGAYNGCVAGLMPIYTLPKSKLAVVFGLMLIQPYYKTDIVGRGIFPDIEIKPTLDDWKNGKDPELNWVLDKCK